MASTVNQLVPDGASPHNYAPSAKDQQGVADADLLVYTSPALEQSLPLDVAANSWALADHTGEPRTPGAAETGLETGAEDPHVWLDPSRVAAALPDLAVALAEIDPERAAGYERRAATYAIELERLDAELARAIETIPRSDRKLVTSHDVIGYFADRYGLQVVGAPFGLAPEAEASAGRLAELIADIEAQDVPAVFAQQGDDPEVLRRVADEAGVVVVDDLLLESLGPQAESYTEMMRFSTLRITEALGGRGGAAG